MGAVVEDSASGGLCGLAREPHFGALTWSGEIHKKLPHDAQWQNAEQSTIARLARLLGAPVHDEGAATAAKPSPPWRATCWNRPASFIPLCRDRRLRDRKRPTSDGSVALGRELL